MPRANLIKTDVPASIFVNEADKDYIIARFVGFMGSVLAGRAGYLSQQALEKYLKAVAVEHRGEYLETHNLKQLAAFCVPFDAAFADSTLIHELTIFDDFTDVGRYGGAAKYDPHAKKTPEFQVFGAMFWSDDYRKLLDKLVFTIRSKVDLSKASGYDGLGAILRDDRSNMFVSEWRLGVPLRDVLTTGNEYFR